MFAVLMSFWKKRNGPFIGRVRWGKGQSVNWSEEKSRGDGDGFTEGFSGVWGSLRGRFDSPRASERHREMDKEAMTPASHLPVWLGPRPHTHTHRTGPGVGGIGRPTVPGGQQVCPS